MIGDSITDAGRTRPIGEGLFDALGKGYVANVDALLTSAYPEHCVRIINQGCGGDTVRELKARWKTDVLDLKPTWLSVMIGINDVWRQFDLPRQTNIHVLPDEYENTLEELIGETRSQITGLILMSPYYIDLNKSDPMRSQMDKYGSIVRRVAEKHDAIFVDSQAAFDAVLVHFHPMSLAWDRIHPNHIGNMILAKAFLNQIGFEW
jgi:lysophospholipase L1-like esterase